eukprot:scaffold4008_cov267-Pinguiococcus_pyrenoidosus.AAC.1
MTYSLPIKTLEALYSKAMRFAIGLDLGSRLGCNRMWTRTRIARGPRRPMKWFSGMGQARKGKEDCRYLLRQQVFFDAPEALKLRQANGPTEKKETRFRARLCLPLCGPPCGEAATLPALARLTFHFLCSMSGGAPTSAKGRLGGIRVA